MKKQPTAIPYPATKEEEERWGFDIHKPKGRPMAWVLDWDSAGAGYGLSPERIEEVRQFKINEDLSTLTVDDLSAITSNIPKYEFHTMARLYEQKYGTERTMELVRLPNQGAGRWTDIQKRTGTPVPLDKIAWFQDAIHSQYGPSVKAYTWFDEEKVVCARASCRHWPPKGMEAGAKFCRAFDNASVEGYMRVEPLLFCFRAPDLGDDGTGSRCVHVWTYNKAVVDSLPDNLKRVIPESTRQVLRSKGAKV